MGKNEEIVITGIGIASSVALTKEEFKQALFKGHWGKTVSQQELTQMIKDKFNPTVSRRMDNYCKYGILAANQAIENADIHINELKPCRVGGIFSTLWGPLETTYSYFQKVLEQGPSYASPFLFPYTVTNSVTGAIARLHGLAGVSTMLVGCCPIIYACELIKAGKADVIVAGGIDNVCSFFNSQEKSIENNTVYEGAAMVTLESKAHAQNRGAFILGEITGIAKEYIKPYTAEENSLSYISNRITKIIINLLGKSKIPLDAVNTAVSMLDGWSGYNCLEGMEKSIYTALFPEKQFFLTRPYKSLNNVYSTHSVLNLYAALLILEQKKIPWEEEANFVSASSKQTILSNSFIYGGNFNSLLIEG